MALLHSCLFYWKLMKHWESQTASFCFNNMSDIAQYHNSMLTMYVQLTILAWHVMMHNVSHYSACESKTRKLLSSDLLKGLMH